MRIRLTLLFTLVAASTRASPNIPLEDPGYFQLDKLAAFSDEPAYPGYFRVVTEARAYRLLSDAHLPIPPSTIDFGSGLWVRPLRRLTARLMIVDEAFAPYETEARIKEEFFIAGGVGASCEHQQGLPCGRGVGGVFDFDAAAGYSRYVSAYVRLRITAGSDRYSPIGSWDRAYVNAEWGPLAAEVGRDVIVLGPSPRTQLSWGDNAPPLDHVRLSALGFALPHVSKHKLRLSALYFIGRLRDPQVFENTLVDALRVQFELFDRVSVGATNLLQFGGVGANTLGFGDWIAEHFTRKIAPDGRDYSNRRVAFDISYRERRLRGLHVYYEVVFEDWRKQFLDAFVYDADHLAGIELPVLTAKGRHGLLVEYQHIGIRSQTHHTWTTGFTNAGEAVGVPPGP